MGVLHERLGEHHAAYQCYRLALMLDPHDTVAGDGLRRYCQRFGYDPGNKAINPWPTDPHEIIDRRIGRHVSRPAGFVRGTSLASRLTAAWRSA